jgi:hypothetical protein
MLLSEMHHLAENNPTTIKPNAEKTTTADNVQSTPGIALNRVAPNIKSIPTTIIERPHFTLFFIRTLHLHNACAKR